MFSRRIKLFRIYDIEVMADLSWFVIFVLVIVSLGLGMFPRLYPEMSFWSYFTMGFLGTIGLFASIVIHEFCHAIVGRYYKMSVKEITLFLFGGVAHLEDEPANAKSEFFMAAAGPLASIVIALALGGIFSFGRHSNWNHIVLGTILYLSQANLALAAFNLIPAFPLDGGRILRSILWAIKKNLRWATRIASIGGVIFGYFLVFSGIIVFIMRGQFAGIWSALIGFLLVSMAKASYWQLLVKQLLQGQSIGSFMNVRPMVLNSQMPLIDVSRYFMYENDINILPVTTDGELSGCVRLNDMEILNKNELENNTANSIMKACPKELVVSPHFDASQIMNYMGKNRLQQLFVVEDRKLLGVVTMASLNRYISLHIKGSPL